MSNEKSEGYSISVGRFPELHADIEAGLLKDGQPRQEQHEEPHPAPRHGGFRKFVHRMLVRVLSVFVAVLLLNLVLNMVLGVGRRLRHYSHNHHQHEALPHHWHEHHWHKHQRPHYPPHHPPHYPQPPCDGPAHPSLPPPPSYYARYNGYAPYHAGYYGYTPYRPEHGYGYRRPYPEYSAYRPGSGYSYNYNTPNYPAPAQGYRSPYKPYVPPSAYVMGSQDKAILDTNKQAFPSKRPHHTKPVIDNAITATQTPSKGRGNATHIKPKPMHEGGNMRRLKQSLKHVDHESLSALIQGSLPSSKLGSLFRTPGDTCVPSIPVDGIESFVFDPTETSSILQTVAGAIGSDISIVPTTDDKASFTARVMASSQDIADKITLRMSTNNEGRISFVLDGPKLISKDECAYAIIELKIPETVTNLTSLRTNYVYGKYELDRTVARKVIFGDFAIATAIGPVMTPPVRASNVDINVVSGNVHGFYRVSNSVSINSVRGDIDAGVNVGEAKKSAISAGSVSGSVSVRVSGNFDGKFSATSLNGKTIVEDASNGSNRLRFDKDSDRVKRGTFGPESEASPGSSSLRAGTINGNVSIEFD
ncbi:hypothetical protein IW140_001494 [Coemansia sp. RSA 1813]|nr:hypothetical protein EV178_003268 [Coemansia sp. RSA 1646]KAJ1771566.1 hypothetical protein LPJ74_002254 [Coemansia sp. RSA 1843]KAJ2089574.1 hypothetical protein IW138_003316 [Coemansia sp. RSA 986]KAJ2214676.1 hypothetical protein EV179_002781 [Coemansia sp. RSA 487]KAJ2571576.1 hypothetical protein IW140_001494 [Coemansia sp. RSA 1813]